MRILWIGGNHPRHLFFINKICEDYPLSAAIIETRENIMPQPPEGIDNRDLDNFFKHFNNRRLAEEKYFGRQELPNCRMMKISEGELNTQKSADFVREMSPDLVIVFGCGLIKAPLISALPMQTINLHLGLSPRYRGAATLFWPFYFLEPAYCGSTFHYIVSEPDAGDVIHQVSPKLDMKDGIHDVACKTVIVSAEESKMLLRIFEDKGHWLRHKQKSTGKNFLSSDFKPEHLRVIYDVYNDQIVKEYLCGRLKSKIPNLIRQF